MTVPEPRLVPAFAEMDPDLQRHHLHTSHGDDQAATYGATARTARHGDYHTHPAGHTHTREQGEATDA